ncbi:MAG: sulfatase [Saprospiraceae bacterium]|nr:sulfatase [Saprospiraceae bacterium]
MKSIIFLAVLFCALDLSISGCQVPNTQDSQKPNIIFIMADDHAAQAISCYGSQMNSTPNIDRIASEGAWFENCFCTNSICSPSRAAILTGKYSHLNGVRDNVEKFNGLQNTYPKYLRNAGYQTAVAGKWHLKSQPTGFDYWNVLPGQGEYHNPVLIENGVEKKHPGYVTDIITDIALDWLKERDREKPFCLMIHHKAVHANWEADDKYANMFSDINIPEPATFYDDFEGRSPQLANHQLFVGPSQWGLHYEYRFGEMPVEGSIQDRKEWMYQRYIKDYLRCVASVDENIGRVLAYLDETGLDKNTIIIYTSDQGFFLGEHGLYDKRFMYEESLRLPLLIRYPKEIKPATHVEKMVLNLDFAETILDYAGVEIPEDMQGKSFRQLAKGQSPEGWRDGMYYRFYEEAYGIGPCEGIRTQQYKLIHYLYGDEFWELYDLKNDPHEMENLYTDITYKNTIEVLKNEMSELRLQYKFGEE